MDYSWRRFQIMVGDDYGIRWLPTYQESANPAAVADRFHPDARPLGPAEHPFPVERIVRYNTMYVETGRFLRELTRDVQIAGGRIEVRKFATPGRHRRACRSSSSSTAPASAPASCSATRSLHPGPRPARRPPAAAGGALRLRRPGRLHVPARRRDPARRDVRAGRVGDDSAAGRRSSASSPPTRSCSPASAAR